MALHTSWMVVGVVVHYTVPNNLFLTYTALLLIGLVTFSTVGIVIFRKELPIQLLLASMTSEAILVVNFTKCRATIVCKVPLAMVATLCGFAHSFYCPISDSCQHVRVA